MAKRRPRKKSLPVRMGEVPTVEFCKQMGRTVEEVIERDIRGKVLTLRHRLYTACVLDAYFLRGLIDGPEHRAGLKYRLAWLRARDGLNVNNPYRVGTAASNCPESMRVIEESERILKMADEKLTTAQKALVIKVCGENRRAGDQDKIDTLGRGLENLARLFKYR